MKKSRYSEEQIMGMLKEHEAGVKTADLCHKQRHIAGDVLHVETKYGGMDVSEAERLKDLEQENSKLKRVVAELTGQHGIEGTDI